MRILIFLILLINISFLSFGQTAIVIDHRHTDISQIPDNWIDSAQKKLNVRYYRRSHGSQLDDGGMTALKNFSSEWAEKYNFSYLTTAGALKLTTEYISVDYDSPLIYSNTRNFLNDPSNASTNVVMLAWSYNFYVSDIQAYIDSMENLIRDYGPNGLYIQNGKRSVPVTFVFHTACSHKDPERNIKIYEGNKLIRQHCLDNNRVLYDFADIEAYNPDGEYFGDTNPDGSYSGQNLLNDDISYNVNETTRGNWGLEWNAANPGSVLAQLSADNICTSCAHSNGGDGGDDNSRLHCVLKGQAAWWLFAIIAGWQNDVSGIENGNLAESFNLRCYPNPFSGQTTIEYRLSDNAKVKLEIWNNNGQLIKVILDKRQSKGNYQLPVDLKNQNGIYFYTLEINGQRSTKKMINF